MTILWLVNIVFPEARALLGNEQTLKSTGGWLVASANELANETLSLYVVSKSSDVKEITFVRGEKIQYVLLPTQRKDSAYNRTLLQEVNDKIQPDVVHIHGTELDLGALWIRECGANNVVLSLQGIHSAIAQYHHQGVTNWDIFRNLTIHDILRESMWGEQLYFKKKGIVEKEVLRKVHFVIGRTSFDKAYSTTQNDNVRYFHCDESLRKEFYDGKWCYSECVKHSIFLSQAQAPLKGLHLLLQAMPIVLHAYPDTTIRIGGKNIVKADTFNDWLRLTGYGKFIRNLIKCLRLSSVVKFLGPLNAEEMRQEMINANVFVCPSTIENSPNSLAEAQMLGVPCIASVAGGIPDFIPSKEFGETYRSDDVVMLAYKICEQFRASSTFDNSKLIEFAHARHDKKKNLDTTLSIYREIIRKTQIL